MNPFVNKVLSTINNNKLISPNAHVLVAVSGGADSTALLHALLALSTHPPKHPHTFAISVAHLNHGIRSEAIEDANFVENICTELNIPFFANTVDVPALAASNGTSLEMAAREARYKFLAETARGCNADAVATAHNRDDQAETLLLKLCRGAGSSGLNGIAYSTTIENMNIIRPLLDISRSNIEDFLTTKNISWREDRTNSDTTIKRNFIRHEILPMLETHLNPRIKETLARTASIMREDNSFMENEAQIALTKCIVSDTQQSSSQTTHNPESLNIYSLRKLPKAILRRVIRQWLIAHGLPSEKMRFDVIKRTIDLILAKKGTGSIPLSKTKTIKRDYKLLNFSETTQTTTCIPLTKLTVPGTTKIESHNIYITATLRTGFERTPTGRLGNYPAEAIIRWNDESHSEIHIRAWQPGDRINPIGMDGSCKLKEIFINNKVPESRRTDIPVFVCEQEIIWIPGYRISRERAVKTQQQKSLHLQISSDR